MNIHLTRDMSIDYAAEDQKIFEHMRTLKLRLVSANTTQIIGSNGIEKSIRHLTFETPKNISKDYFFGIAGQVEVLINKDVKVLFE